MVEQVFNTCIKYYEGKNARLEISFSYDDFSEVQIFCDKIDQLSKGTNVYFGYGSSDNYLNR